MMTPCPRCGKRLTFFAHVVRCFSCQYRKELDPATLDGLPTTALGSHP